MGSQVMYRPVRERLRRLMPSPETPHVGFTIFTIFFLAACCVNFLSEVEKLKGTYGLLQMLRMVAVAHIFRFLQSIFGENQVPLSLYLRKVLPFYDLPITLAIAAFYTSIGIFPKPLNYVPVLVLFLLLSFLVFMSKVLAQASPSNTEPVGKQNHDATVDLILAIIMELFQMEPNDTSAIEVIDHFAIILLTGMCVDLVVQDVRVRGIYELVRMVLVLVGRHFFYITIEFFVRPNSVHPLYYLRKVLLFYDIPFTATFAAFYSNFGTPSDTLFLIIILELSLLVWIHGSISKRANLNITQGMEPEQDIRSTQASSSTSVLVASNGVNRDLSAVNQESTASAAISICESTNFSTWERGKRIGAGGFGTVYVLHDRKNRRSCAVKQLIDIHDAESIESIRKEIDILSKLEHSNIVKYYGHKEVERRIYLYMEYIEPGSLKQYISKKGVLDEPLIRKFTAQIQSGLVYLHSERVIHRDLKPENILVDSGDIVKLVDFGLAKELEESVGKHSVGATYEYAAPEVRGRGGYNRSSEGYAADIWSLGCVIIEMFSGKKSRPDSKTKHPPIPDQLCEEGKDFLLTCFKITPAERQSATELQEHRFVKNTNYLAR